MALVKATCEGLFAYRRMQPWPTPIVVNDGWDAIYAEAAQGLDVIPDVRGAVEWVNQFIEEIEK